MFIQFFNGEFLDLVSSSYVPIALPTVVTNFTTIAANALQIDTQAALGIFYSYWANNTVCCLYFIYFY